MAEHWLTALRSKWRRSREGVMVKGTFVMEAEMHRSEDLRPDTLGVPTEDEIRQDRPHDPWRPARTLGR